MKASKMIRQNTLSQSQKLLISRIIFVLKNSQKLNTTQIQEILSNLNLPSYSLKSLYSCMKELQMDEIVTCDIIKKEENEPQIITDYFSLTKDTNRLEQLQIEVSYDRKRKKMGKEYVIIRCPKCKSYRIAHFPFKKIKCFNCGQMFSESNIINHAKTRSEIISILKNLESKTN
jgi:ribosomal protein S27E